MTRIKSLLDLLKLEQIEHNIFRGQSQDVGSKRVFGGQVLAQSLQACTATVGSDRLCHSLHAYFILAGDVNAPIVFNVDRIRDGRSFTTRRAVAIQHGRPIFNMAASYQLDQPGLDYACKAPKVTMPEDLPSISELIKPYLDKLPRVVTSFFSEDHPIEYKPVEVSNYLNPEKRDPVRHLWFKTRGQMPDNQAAHRCVLAYISDFYLLGTALLPHAIPLLSQKVKMASLDHAIWFHREFRTDEWLLYAVESPNTSNSRGFCRGNVFNRQGQLVASVAQEGMVRMVE
ncbi:MAG: acyl-CoA thioesterase II [Bacteroidota bacterium]